MLTSGTAPLAGHAVSFEEPDQVENEDLEAAPTRSDGYQPLAAEAVSDIYL